MPTLPFPKNQAEMERYKRDPSIQLQNGQWMQTYTQSQQTPQQGGRAPVLQAPNLTPQQTGSQGPVVVGGGATASPANQASQTRQPVSSGTTNTSPQTYTVKPGDTLSGIAKSLGLPSSSLSGFRSGNPNLIYPGEVLNIAETQSQVAQEGASPSVEENVDDAFQETDLDLDISSELDSQTFEKLFTNPVTSSDISKLLQEQEKLREERRKLVKSPEEVALENKLVDLQQKIEQNEIGFQLGSLELENQAIPMQIISGQQGQLEKQALLERQTLLSQERNLLGRLGLFQEERELQKEAFNEELGFLSNDINLRFKIQDRVDQQRRDALSQMNTLQDNARLTLDRVLDAMGGLADLDDLSPKDTRELERLARMNGIPFETLEVSLKAAKSQQQFENVLKAEQEARLRNNQNRETEADRKRRMRQQVVDRAQPILEESRGEVDGYADPGTYLDLRQQYFSEFGNTSGFDDLFSNMLSPQERNRLGIGRIGAVGGSSLEEDAQDVDLQNVLKELNKPFYQTLFEGTIGRIF